MNDIDAFTLSMSRLTLGIAIFCACLIPGMGRIGETKTRDRLLMVIALLLISLRLKP